MPDYAPRATDDLTRTLRVGTTVILPSPGEPPVSCAPSATAEPSGPAPSGIRRVAEYELLEMIGAGGMGRVFKARHTWLDKIVAIKLLPEGIFQQPQAVARFLREAQMMACLDHPNVVRATDAGEEAGVHYLVAELVVGQDLAHVVARGGRLNVADACAVTCQVASALQYAHQKGLVHRDIKPSNVMLTTDFIPTVSSKCSTSAWPGWAREHDGLTASGHVARHIGLHGARTSGRPRSVDVRADIYSLGCTLYFLLAASPPFGGTQFDSAASKLRRTCIRHHRIWRGFAATCRLACWHVWRKCLPKIPPSGPPRRSRSPSSWLDSPPDANLARLLDPTTTTNQCRTRQGRTWSVFSLLWTTVLLPWTLLCGAGRMLGWLGRSTIAIEPPTPQRREPVFSAGGLLLLRESGCFVGPVVGLFVRTARRAWYRGSGRLHSTRIRRPKRGRRASFQSTGNDAFKIHPHKDRMLTTSIGRDTPPVTWESTVSNRLNLLLDAELIASGKSCLVKIYPPGSTDGLVALGTDLCSVGRDTQMRS